MLSPIGVPHLEQNIASSDSSVPHLVQNDIDKSKIELIKNFPIPNTKEDISEFVILAASNINPNCYGFWGTQYPNNHHKSLSDAWLAKMEQAYYKALLMFGETREFKTIKQVYDDKKIEISRKVRSGVLFWVCIIGGILLIGGAITALTLSIAL